MWAGFVSVLLLVVGVGGLITIIALLSGPAPGSETTPIERREVCAHCGRAFHREHMVPVHRGSEIEWLCQEGVKKGLDRPVSA